MWLRLVTALCIGIATVLSQITVYSDCHLVVALLSPVMVPYALKVQPIWHGQEGYSVVVLGVAIFTEQLTVS